MAKGEGNKRDRRTFEEMGGSLGIVAKAEAEKRSKATIEE
tara:strand:+ start:376 stop:495 length:120 start_codon:yes stop_codon:yes gene_type:complete